MKSGLIVLDTRWTAWTTCGVCGRDIPLIDGGCALPMYEGRVDWDSPVMFPVCGQCFSEAGRLTIVVDDDGYPD